MSVNREALYVPEPNEILEIIGTKDNKTTGWALNVERAQRGAGEKFMVVGRIIGAKFQTDADQRVARQRESLDRLLRHVSTHCPRLLGLGDCPFVNEEGLTHD